MNSVSNQEGNSWEKVFPFVKPFTAGMAIAPSYKDLVKKSFEQMEKTMPRMTCLGGLKEGLVKGMPLVTVTVGLQLVANDWVKSQLMKWQKDQQEKPNLSTSFFSAMAVGGVVAYPLTVLNSLTSGESWKKSLKFPSGKVFGAMVGRETSFLLSEAIAEFVNKPIKMVGGDNLVTKYTSTFVGGVIGSIVGHGADTAVTRWRKGQDVIFKHLTLGMRARAMGIGKFYVFYTLLNDLAKHAYTKTGK